MDSRANKVAFGMAFPEEGDMSKIIHGKPMPAGCLRVSVDGWIKPDALIPYPVAGVLETVKDAVGSHVAWPKDFIIFRNTEVFYFYKYNIYIISLCS